MHSFISRNKKSGATNSRNVIDSTNIVVTNNGVKFKSKTKLKLKLDKYRNTFIYVCVDENKIKKLVLGKLKSILWKRGGQINK